MTWENRIKATVAFFLSICMVVIAGAWIGVAVAESSAEYITMAVLMAPLYLGTATVMWHVTEELMGWSSEDSNNGQ